MKPINTYINESKCNQVDDLPKIETLEDGLYEGKLNGYCFYYENKEYKSPIGILSMFPTTFYIEIKENKVIRAGGPNKDQMFDYKYEN